MLPMPVLAVLFAWKERVRQSYGDTALNVGFISGITADADLAPSPWTLQDTLVRAVDQATRSAGALRFQRVQRCLSLVLTCSSAESANMFTLYTCKGANVPRSTVAPTDAFDTATLELLAVHLHAVGGTCLDAVQTLQKI